MAKRERRIDVTLSDPEYQAVTSYAVQEAMSLNAAMRRAVRLMLNVPVEPRTRRNGARRAEEETR